MTVLDRPKREKKNVTRLTDEYLKYTKGKYHGWKDTYDRKYNGHDYPSNKNSNSNNKKNKKNKTYIHELPFPI